MTTKKPIYELISSSVTGRFLSTSKTWLMAKAAELGLEDPLITEVYCYDEDIEDNNNEYGYKYTGVVDITVPPAARTGSKKDLSMNTSDVHWKFTPKLDDNNTAVLLYHSDFHDVDTWHYYVSFYTPTILISSQLDSQLKAIAFNEFKSRKVV